MIVSTHCKMSQSIPNSVFSPSTPLATLTQQRQSVQSNPASQWLTPPEQLHDSFSQRCSVPSFAHPSATAAFNMTPTVGASSLVAKPTNSQQALSPPISPLTKINVGDNVATHSVKDPILYPEEPLSPSNPLFGSKLSPEEQNVISGHIEARKTTPLPAGVRTPKREEYELFYYLFKEVAWTNYFQSTRAGRAAWLERERAQLKMDAQARIGRKAKPISRIMKEKPLMARPSGLPMSTTVTGLSARPRSSSKVVKTTISRPIRTNPTKTIHSRVSDTPQPEKKRTTTQADQDFNSIPDFCPPLSTLTSNNVMKTPSVTNAREFEKHELHLLPLLHPDEQRVAANLRLDPATYLTSKRRIFVARLRHFHEGKVFRKTHAQIACKIDVNKASKLHTAFESVGWFDDKWMRNLPRPETEI